VAGGELPVTDMLSGCVLSLPMHPYLDEETQDRVDGCPDFVAVTCLHGCSGEMPAHG
jgi:hypothetical protein